MNNDVSTQHERIKGFDPRIFFAKGVEFETADLLIGAPSSQVVGRTGAVALALYKSNGDSVFPGGVAVIAPPLSAWDKSDDDVIEMIGEGIQTFRGDLPAPDEIERIRRSTTILRCKDLDSNTLLAKFAGLENTLIIVPFVHLYQSAGSLKDRSLGKASVMAPADIWIPHVAAWSDRCIKALKDTNNYLVLSTPEKLLFNDRKMQQLIDVENLYPVSLSFENGPDYEAIIAENIQRWIVLAVSGRVDEALEELSLLEIGSSERRQLEIQVLNRSSYRERTLAALQSYVDDGCDLQGEQSVRFGRIAFRQGEKSLAKGLISQGLHAVCDRKLLETTLITCESLDDDNLTLRAYQRLRELFPNSSMLARYREAWLIRLSGALKPPSTSDAISRIGFLSFESVVAEAFLNPSEDKLQNLLDACGTKPSSGRDLALVCCTTYALTQLNTRKALRLATDIDEEGHFRLRASWLLLEAMKRTLLEKDLHSDPLSVLEAPIAYLRRYIAHSPHDVETREAFSRLFDVDASASLGAPLLIAQMLSLAQNSVILRMDEEEQLVATPKQLDRFLGRIGTWLEEVGVYDVSHSEIPHEFFEDRPLALLNALDSLIRSVGNDPEGGMEYAEHLAFLACGVARHVEGTTVDINALRFVACGFATSGRSQRARDRAEQILELAGESAVRKRATWVAFADIYHRTRGPLVALLGLACAFELELEQPVTADELWWESYTCFRIARDLGLSSQAQSLLTKLKALTPLISCPEESKLRITTLELSLRLKTGKGKDLAYLEGLVTDAELHCTEILKARDEKLPSIMILAQAVGFLESAGGRASDSARALLDLAFGSLGESRAGYLQAMTAGDPGINDALLLAKRSEPTRNTEDVPGDMLASEIVARRVLQAQVSSISAQTAAAAIELISDHGLDPLEGARELNAQWPLELIKQIRPEDAAIVMMGLDSTGSLITLTADQYGEHVARQDDDATLFRKAVSNWSPKYPYHYGHIDREEGNNEFFLSMQEFQIQLPEAQRVIVVAEPSVQQVPLNLLVLNDDLAGYHKAIGYVPSLTWLDAMMRKPRVTSNRRVAWISDSTSGRDDEVLGRVLMRSEETLREHGFSIDSTGHVPQTLKDAQIAVIAAHGGVGATGKFLQRVSDEGTLVVSPGVLARSLKGTELVILFVCNGGRTDKDPLANTAVGLHKQLLSAGCRTVIASPWPLFASVPGPWLTSFLRSWEAGHTALDATFIANKTVDEHFGSVPQYALAMTVYGDVLMNKE